MLQPFPLYKCLRGAEILAFPLFDQPTVWDEIPEATPVHLEMYDFLGHRSPSGLSRVRPRRTR